MWEISNSGQAFSFLLAVVLGGIFCLFFDVFRSIRKNFEHSILAVFAEDILYFAVITPITFCFLLATTNGELRFYVFFAMLLGFIITRLTVSRVFMALVCGLLRLLSLFSKAFYGFLRKVKVIFENFFKKALNIRKKLLKKQ